MASRRRKRAEDKDLEAKPEESAVTAEGEPVAEPDATTLIPPAEPEPVVNDPKPTPAPASNEGPRVVMGNQAVDPNRHRRGPIPMTAHIYCGIKGIRSPVNAGFEMWAKINGHTEQTREEWDQLFETYKTSPVR